MTDNRHVTFRNMLPAHVLRRIDDEQGSVPMFSPSVAVASAGAVGRGRGGAVAEERGSSSRRQQQRPRLIAGFENGELDSNKENSPFVAPKPSSMMALTTPTPRKPRPHGWGKSPALSSSSSSSSAASRETAFFTPVAKSVSEMLRLDDDNEDDGAGRPQQEEEEDKDMGASGGRRGSRQQQTPKKEPTMEESFTPFSGITHSTAMRSTADVPPMAHPKLGSKNADHASIRRLSEFQSAFTPKGIPTSSANRRGLSVAASKSPKESQREAMVASSPFKSLPRLDMLTSNYLNSCNDAPTLRRIIRVLESEGQQAYPRLLEIATTRLNDVLQNPVPPTLVLPPSPSARLLHHSTADGSNRNNDSLTLSTDTEDEVRSLQLLRETLEKQRRYSYRHPTSSAIVTQYSPSNAQQATLMQQQLRQTEDKLQRTVQEVEGLQQLLQTSSLQHDQSTTDLKEAITKLQVMLDRQRAANEQSQSEAVTYKARAQELTQQLEKQKRDHDQVKITLEGKQRQLTEFLHSSQRNTVVVTAERTEMLRRMVHAMSSSDAGSSSDFQVEKLTKEERIAIVADFCAHVANSKSQLDELAAMVRETEKERRKILKAYKQVKQHYVETHNCMVGLERDNHLLSNEIEYLTQQLKEAQHQNAEIQLKQSTWDKRQQEANTVIRRLKEQIRSTEAMVPIGVYKSALENADLEAAKAEQYKSRVAALTKQVASLSARLTREGKAPPPPPPPPPSSRRALQPKQPANAAHSTPVRPQPSPTRITPLENKPPLSINTKHEPPRTADRKAVSFKLDTNRTVDTPKSASKMAMVRAAGGRKALEEQLRKARSPRNQQPS